MPQMRLVTSFLGHARRMPSRPALSHRGLTVDYGALMSRARQGCSEVNLADGGGETTAVLARKSPASIALLMGCFMSARPVLVPSVDLGPAGLAAIFGQAGCRCVLRVAGWSDPVAQEDVGAAPRATSVALGHGCSDETALLLTTSGSTGVPKVVPLTAAAIDRFAEWAGATFGITTGTTVLSYAPLNFDLSILDVWATLSLGGRVVLIDEDAAANPRLLVEAFVKSQIEVVQGVPMLFRLLVDAVPPGIRFPSVRHVIFTGDILPRPVLQRLPALFPRARLYNVYGCTETNDSFMYEVQSPPSAAPEPLPIGWPLPGVQAQLQSPDGLLVPGEGSGELLVSTPFQTPGYLVGGDDRFVPLADGRTYFRTGDLVQRRADASLSLIGRNDFQVKIRGFRINLLEIEAVLLQHAQVTEAVVLAPPDQCGDRRLIGYARRIDGSRLNGLELRAHCAERLTRAAIPSTIHVVDEPLPRTSTGKVDRQRIAAAVHGG